MEEKITNNTDRYLTETVSELVAKILSQLER